ncbi:hypothetical protein GUITHDRAFT_76089 [Guillardia theta CCMP2712]|uniref:Uncharacterized protein n=1 Tax=Guillardia theta (strain CCMP2712) TaxID=905079 RepID=L1IVG0_GUITC|nr:hypothetical protein GUITHDRAFT_76089 [Guillardia theta CCMP2712]EKX39805.1 hypothetical protein GUITHDRAFT_76089 [Guillardia theta CCMP2712]|eukprot:XP_005826785.1 hypothetical protein GUITHDRAFT_76089 [Guillardia theta CCMP2712]
MHEPVESFLVKIARSCSQETFVLREFGILPGSLAILLNGLNNRLCQLDKLDLSCNKIGDEGGTLIGEFLASNRTLKTLVLQGSSIGPPGQRAIFDALKGKNTSLSSLDLGCCGAGKNVCGDEGCLALAEALRRNTSLARLSLSANRLSPGMMSSLSRGLGRNLYLTQLDLSDNMIHDEGATSLAQSLSLLHLSELSLCRNSIASSGAEKIAYAIELGKPGITTLDLSGNAVGYGGCRAFADILSYKNTVLTALKLRSCSLHLQEVEGILRYPRSLTMTDLSKNEIGDKGLLHLSRVLASNRSIQHVDLSFNSIGDAGASALSSVLKTNESLTELDVSWNNLREAGLHSLC